MIPSTALYFSLTYLILGYVASCWTLTTKPATVSWLKPNIRVKSASRINMNTSGCSSKPPCIQSPVPLAQHWCPQQTLDSVWQALPWEMWRRGRHLRPFTFRKQHWNHSRHRQKTGVRKTRHGHSYMVTTYKSKGKARIRGNLNHHLE